MGINLKISLAYLMKNKLRTSLLIFGVILGIVLIFGTNVIKESNNKNDLNVVKKLYGGHHVEFNDLSIEDIKKLENDYNVSKITTVQNLGSVVNDKGNSILLKSVNKDYINDKSNKLTGRLPKNNNEIVLEKKALDSMKIPYKLNSTLNLTVKKEYKDNKGNNIVYTKDKVFKLVGIIEKPKGYYDVVWTYEGFTYGNTKEDNIIPQKAVNYNSILNLKTGTKNLDENIKKIRDRNNLGRTNFLPNVPLVQKLVDIEMESDKSNEAIKIEILIIITASIFIFNIFNITLNQTIKEMGLLRLIGLSKKKVRLILTYQALIIMVIGIILGLTFGTLYSYVGVNIYNVDIFKEALFEPKLYISNKNILKAILVGVFSVFISFIIPILKIGNISPIDAINNTEKSKSYSNESRLNKISNKIFGFYGFMGLKNIGRNKFRSIISLTSIALGGYVFITTFSSMQEEVNSKIEDMQNRYDAVIEFNGAVSELDNLKYTDSDVKKIKDIQGVKSVNEINIVDGFFYFKKDEINKEFAKYNKIENTEHKMDLKIYKNHYINTHLKNFIENGNINDLGKETDGYPNVAVYNYFYDREKDYTLKNVFNNINVGDILTIKVPTKEGKKTVYKDKKVRVCATLKPDWMSMGDGQFGNNFEIVTSINHSKSLIGEQKYTKLGINLENPYDENVDKKLKEISDSIHLSTFESRVGYKNWSKELSKDYIKSKISLIVLVLIIAQINIFCTIRTNLLVRRKEISTLRALGLSIKNMRKIIIYESLAYSILSFMIYIIPSTINLIKFVKLNNNAYINYGIENFMEFTFPFKETTIFLIISICMCLIAITKSNKDFKEMNIIEGIKDND